jgi:phosphoglycerate-specific signal transduction histidine kinase
MAPGRINQTRMQSPKAGQKSGWLSTIRGRLYLAFGFAASLTIIGSSIAFYEFTVIGLTTNEIASRSLPTTTVSLRLAEQATSLVSSGPRLMAAGTDAIRAEIIENIGKQEKNLEDGIAHLKKLGIAKADDIEASRKTLADRLQTLNEAVSHRIIMSNERAYLASSVRAAHEALLIGLAPAIDDANFDLMMGARQEGAAALDARLEYLRRLLETESESNLLAGLLTEASLVSDASRLEPLRDLIDSAQRKITKNLSAIGDHAQQHKLTALYKQLSAIGADDGILCRTRL